MKRTTIKEVAREAGVSITTVSRALNGYHDISPKTKERIQKVVEELNYAPDINARSLGGISDTTIALVASDLQPKNESGFVFSIISGVYWACQDCGCEFILLATNSVKQEKVSFLQLCRKKNIDGIVVMGLRVDDPYYQEVVQSPIPCALIDLNINIKSNHICNISIDNCKASQEAVQYLIQRGHSRIAMINGEAAATVSKDRFQGYANALQAERIRLEMDYVVYGDFKEQKAYDETRCLLQQRPEVSAIFCASDLMAMGAIRAILDLGKRVPDDISVIGFDDMPVAAYVYGGLTTVRQQPFEMGQMAGNAVHRMLKKENVPIQWIAPSEFIIRGTVSEKK